MELYITLVLGLIALGASAAVIIKDMGGAND